MVNLALHTLLSKPVLDWLDLNLVQVNILCYKNLFSESRLCVDHLAEIFKPVN